MRFNVQDHPGVLGQVTSLLGAQGISIASVIQHEVSDSTGNNVPLVIMTHQAKESAAVAAMDQIAKMDTVSDDLERLRILD